MRRGCEPEIRLVPGRWLGMPRHLLHEQRADDDNDETLIRVRTLLAARRLCLLGPGRNCNDLRGCHACLARRLLILAAQLSLSLPSHFVTFNLPAGATDEDLYPALRSLVRRLRYRGLHVRLAMFAERGPLWETLHWHGWAWGDALGRPRTISVIEDLALTCGFTRAQVAVRHTPTPPSGVDLRSCEGMSYPLKELIESRTVGGALSGDQLIALARNHDLVPGYVSKNFYRTPTGRVISSKQSMKLATAALAGALDPEQFAAWFHRRLCQLGRTGRAR